MSFDDNVVFERIKCNDIIVYIKWRKSTKYVRTVMLELSEFKICPLTAAWTFIENNTFKKLSSWGVRDKIRKRFSYDFDTWLVPKSAQLTICRSFTSFIAEIATLRCSIPIRAKQYVQKLKCRQKCCYNAII